MSVIGYCLNDLVHESHKVWQNKFLLHSCHGNISHTFSSLLLQCNLYPVGGALHNAINLKQRRRSTTANLESCSV